MAVTFFSMLYLFALQGNFLSPLINRCQFPPANQDWPPDLLCTMECRGSDSMLVISIGFKRPYMYPLIFGILTLLYEKAQASLLGDKRHME